MTQAPPPERGPTPDVRARDVARGFLLGLGLVAGLPLAWWALASAARFAIGFDDGIVMSGTILAAIAGGFAGALALPVSVRRGKKGTAIGLAIFFSVMALGVTGCFVAVITSL